jgi:hypothetical protein
MISNFIVSVFTPLSIAILNLNYLYINKSLFLTYFYDC